MAPHSRHRRDRFQKQGHYGKGEGGEHYFPRPKKNSYYRSSLGSPETVSEEPKSEQHDPRGAGGPEGTLALEIVEREMEGAFGSEGATSEELELEKAFVPEPEADKSGEDSSDDKSEP